MCGLIGGGCHPCTPPLLPATPEPHPPLPPLLHLPQMCSPTATTSAWPLGKKRNNQSVPALFACDERLHRPLAAAPTDVPPHAHPGPCRIAAVGNGWIELERSLPYGAPAGLLCPTANSCHPVCLLACRGCCLSLSEACRAHAAVHDFAQATVTMPLGASHCRRASQVGTRAAQFAPAIPPLTVCSPPFPSCFHPQTCAPGGSRCCTSLCPPCRTAVCAASQWSSNGVSTQLVAGVWPLWMGVWLMDPSRRLVWAASAACPLVAWWLLGRRVEPKSLAQPLWPTGR